MNLKRELDDKGIKYTQQDIAHMLGISRKTAGKYLRELSQSGEMAP